MIASSFMARLTQTCAVVIRHPTAATMVHVLTGLLCHIECHGLQKAPTENRHGMHGQHNVIVTLVVLQDYNHMAYKF